MSSAKAYLSRLANLESLDISFTYVDTVEPLLSCRNLQTLDISDTHIEDVYRPNEVSSSPLPPTGSRVRKTLDGRRDSGVHWQVHTGTCVGRSIRQADAECCLLDGKEA